MLRRELVSDRGGTIGNLNRFENKVKVWMVREHWHCDYNSALQSADLQRRSVWLYDKLKVCSVGLSKR